MSIKSEWDNIAWERLQDRLEGNDLSYNDIFLPVITKSVGQCKGNKLKVFDFGCGTGELTFEVSKTYPEMEFVGFDISKYSIKLAEKHFSSPNLSFIDSLDKLPLDSNFDFVIANMSLMDTEDLDCNLLLLSQLLVEDGKFFIIITHPSFWPIYWNYTSDASFRYNEESKITKTYKTKNKIFKGFKTTHFHRPLSFYINGLIRHKLKLQDMQEIKGANDDEWYPRFLFLELIKETTN